jgi:hypothetical protein
MFFNFWPSIILLMVATVLSGIATRSKDEFDEIALRYKKLLGAITVICVSILLFPAIKVFMAGTKLSPTDIALFAISGALLILGIEIVIAEITKLSDITSFVFFGIMIAISSALPKTVFQSDYWKTFVFFGLLTAIFFTLGRSRLVFWGIVTFFLLFINRIIGRKRLKI